MNMPRIIRIQVRKKILEANERARRREQDRAKKIIADRENEKLQRRLRGGSAGATPETRRKLRASVIARLAKQGRLDERQLNAARTLGALWLAIDSGGMASVDSIERLKSAGVTGSRKNTEPATFVMFDPMYLHVYRPWAAKAKATTIKTNVGRVTLFELVYVCVCYNVGPRQLDQAMRVRHGVAFGLIDGALRDFDNAFRGGFRSLR